VWRMYLRRADDSPSNSEACGKNVQETISNMDQEGRELGRDSAMVLLSGEGALSYAGLPCFEAKQQYFETLERKR